MINLAESERTGIRHTTRVAFDRVVRQRIEAYALIVALLSVGALAVIH